jgi:hypothetical protein
MEAVGSTGGDVMRDDFSRRGWDMPDDRLSDEAIYRAVDFWTDPRFRKDTYDMWVMNKMREAIRRALETP